MNGCSYRLLRAVVIVKDSDEKDEKMEIATRRKRKENRVPANAQELVHGDCLSTRPSDPSRSSLNPRPLSSCRSSNSTSAREDNLQHPLARL
jgi:hypothetical protein